jgi:beta-lactamase regulating signal transducer with metallopeptidase domain
MENSTFFKVYFLTLLISIALTITLIFLIQPGLKKYFENLSQDSEIAKFFLKLTNIILLLAGIGAALKSGYDTDEKANWLTLTWNSASQLQETLSRLSIILMIFAILFFILYLINRQLNK